jgi:hypothetical protein
MRVGRIEPSHGATIVELKAIEAPELAHTDQYIDNLWATGSAICRLLNRRESCPR